MFDDINNRAIAPIFPAPSNFQSSQIANLKLKGILIIHVALINEIYPPTGYNYISDIKILQIIFVFYIIVLL